MTNPKTNTNKYDMDAMLSAVQTADSVLLFCHVSPDGDTVGSALALMHRLRRMGKRARVLMSDPVPDSLAFLPGALEVEGPDARPEEDALLLAVDVASAERLGAFQKAFQAAALAGVIDHHPTNPGFAPLCLIDGDAPATAVVVKRLFDRLSMPLSPEEAVCLYAALSTDTGNFVYESTNAECFLMMAALMDAGLNLSEYSRLLFRQKKEAFVRVLAQALPTLRISRGGMVAGLTLSNEMLRKAGALPMHTEGVVNYALDIEGVKLAWFAHEAPDGRVKLSLRALPPFRVDELAARLGGGGHRLAAGVTLAMPLAEAAALIERELEAL